MSVLVLPSPPPPSLVLAGLLVFTAVACEPGSTAAGPAGTSAAAPSVSAAAPSAAPVASPSVAGPASASGASGSPAGVVLPPAPAGSISVGLRVRDVDRHVTLDEALRTLPAVTLPTNAPAYHGANKRYRGVELSALLVEEGAKLDGDVYLTFVCNDGYRSQIPAALLRKYRAVLAWAEVDSRGHQVPFEPFTLASGKRMDPAPLYLVWEPRSIKETYPAGWPAGVLRIEVSEGSGASALDPARLAPTEASASVRQGFDVYSRICFACHSLSGVGGRIGPELNRPMNVTTYWVRPVLEQYIRDWQTVREAHGNEKMPRLTDVISAAEAAAVVDYLAWMKGRTPQK